MISETSDQVPARQAASSVPAELMAKAKEEAFRLPQGRLLDDTSVERWIEAVYAIEAPRLLWHVRRAGGFGGSEIGNLVAWESGIYDVWTSPRDLVRSKLLYATPEPSSDDAQRGLIMEAYIRRMAETRIPGFERDTRALEALRGGRHKDYSWMIGTPDDVILIGGKRYAIDYKAPKKHIRDEYLKKGISLDYRAQLSHYRQIGESIGLTFYGVANIFSNADALALHGFHFFEAVQSGKASSIDTYTPPRLDDDFDIVVHDEDPELDLALRIAGEKYWQKYVMRGDLPPMAVKPRIILENGAIPPEIEAAARRFGRLSLLKPRLEDERENSKEAVSAWIRRIGTLEDGKLTLSILGVSEKAEPDLERMAARLEALGMPREELVLPGDVDADKAITVIQTLAAKLGADPSPYIEQARGPAELDQARIQARFQEVGLDPNPYLKTTYRFDTPRAKKGALGAQMEIAKQSATKAIEDLGNTLDIETLEAVMQDRLASSIAADRAALEASAGAEKPKPKSKRAARPKGADADGPAAEASMADEIPFETGAAAGSQILSPVSA
jgi:hypothetical protein